MAERPLHLRATAGDERRDPAASKGLRSAQPPHVLACLAVAGRRAWFSMRATGAGCSREVEREGDGRGEAVYLPRRA